MADGDKITIENINWDDSNLPKWATEATQLKIAKALGAIKKTDDKEEKENKKQTKSLQDVVKRVEQLNKTSAESSKKMVAQLNKKGGDYTKDLVKKNIQTPFKSVNMAIQKFAGKLGIVGAALGVVAAGIGFVIGRLKQFSDSFRQVFAMGFRMEQGSLGLAKAAVAAEMGINQYTELLGKFSTSVGIIGAKSFSDLNVAIRDNLQAQGMLGMSLSELAEYTGDFMDQLRTASMLGNKSNDELEELVVRYAQNITAFSQLANVSRDQIAAIIKSSTAVEAFTNKLNLLPATVQSRVLQAAQTVTGMFAGLGTEFGDQLASTFTTAYGRGGLFFTEAGRELLAVNRDLYNSLSNIINNLDAMDDQGAARATSELITQIANTSDAERARLQVIERSNTQYAGAARQQIALINQVQEIQRKGALEQYKDLQRLRRESQIDRLSKAFINFERVTAKLSVAFNKFFTELFGNDRILGAISGALDQITALGIDVAKKLVDNAGSIANKIASLVERFMDFVGGFKGLTLGQSLARALSGVFGLMSDMIVGAITKGFKIALPGYLGGDADMKKAEANRAEAVKSQYAIQKMIAEGNYDPSSIGNIGVSNEFMKSQGFGATIKGGLDRSVMATLTQGMTTDDVAKLKSITGDFDDLGKTFMGGSFSGSETVAEDVIQAVLQKVKGTDMEATVYRQLLEMNKNIARFESNNVSKLAGTTLATGADVANQVSDTGEITNTGGGTLTSNSDPLDEAKMRIMKQYLPMLGSKDPNEDPAGNYYSTSIELLRQQIEELKKITSSTKTTADAAT
tara:strand:+ start:2198 stop:4594 length:2397 start_codon:yes stop_codon:yes gene_type:complete